MKKVLIVLLLAAAFCGVTTAAGTTAEEIMANMEKTDKTVNSLEFDFQQEIVYILTNEKNINAGKVSFQKPDSICMLQTSPLEQTVITNGKKVWIYTPKYKQVIIDSWKKWTSNSLVPITIINFGKEWKGLKKRYVITSEGMDSGKYVLLFVPKEKEGYKMKFWVEPESYIPVKIEIIGNNVTIVTEMKSKTINPIIDKKIFNFKAPAGVEVMNLP